MNRANELAARVEKAIADKIKDKARLIVAIDGRCASGKTTLAEQLKAKLGCTVIHMDHFFLRPEQRTPERLATPGENVDHERFLREVLLPLREGDAISYRPFDCRTMTLATAIECNVGRVCIIEGSYSCHSALFPYYDLTVFMTVASDEQLRRIERRNGRAALDIFREKWIPLEEAYFSASKPSERCDLFFET